jgi:hypothetical protein
MGQADGAYQERAQPGHKPIGYSQRWCPFSGTIEDRQLMFDQQRLPDYRPNASRPSESNKSNDEMDKKEGKITHPGILSKL